MKRIRLGKSNIEVPTVSLGTWAHGGPSTVSGRPVGWFGVDEDEALASLLAAFESGITHWDTADVYGDGRAEQLIGRAWEHLSRDDVILASKVGWDPGSHSHYYHPEQIRRQLEASLRHLRTDYLDLYYLHHCDFGPNAEYLDEAVELLRRFRDQGKIRSIGLSDWKPELILKYGERVAPDVIQTYRNVVDDAYESSGLKAWVDANDVGAVFFSPLKHALLLGIFEGPVTFGHGDHRSALPDFRDFKLISRLRACRNELERRYQDHEEPVLSALVGALLSDSPTGCALVGLHRREHVASAARIGDPLPTEEARWVRQLYQENGHPTRASWKSFQL